MNQISQAHSIVGQSRGRPETDFYPTPPVATIELLQRERFDGTICEPCCGTGAISEILKEKRPFSDIYSYDLNDYGYGETGVDFLEANRLWDNIITNPPYSLASEFVQQALDRTTGKVAMLLKTVFLEGVSRYGLFKSTPLKTVYVFSGRLTLYRNGEKLTNQGMISYSWFVWDHNYNGLPNLDWILLDKNVQNSATEQVKAMKASELLLPLCQGSLK